MEEKILIERAKAGNKSALNTLLTNNLKMLEGYTLKMTGDPYLAQDIVQDTLLKGVLHIHKFKPQGKFSTWLITIAINTYRDHLRKHKRVEPLEENLRDEGESLEEKVMINVEYRTVMDILMGLSLERRTTFILKPYYGYKYEEIGKILNCPVGTVRSRLHYTVKYIISQLEGKGML